MNTVHSFTLVAVHVLVTEEKALGKLLVRFASLTCESEPFEREFLKLQLAGTRRGEYLSRNLSIVPLPPKTRSPGKPKAPVKC